MAVHVTFAWLRACGTTKVEMPRLLRSRTVCLTVATASFACVASALTTSSAAAQVSPNNVVSMPARASAGRDPLGWIILIHGGGWSVVGRNAVAEVVPTADFFLEHGWATYNVDYRAGSVSLADVLSAYDALRDRVGPRAPVCAWGASAGGNLALLLAGYRRSLKCVISEAGPTDLVTLASEPAYAPPRWTSHTGPEWVLDDCAARMLGPTSADLWWWSPVRLAARILAHILLATSAWDPLMPRQQMWDLARLRPDVTKVMLLAGGNATFTHAPIAQTAVTAWETAELALLATARGTHLRPVRRGVGVRA